MLKMDQSSVSTSWPSMIDLETSTCDRSSSSRGCKLGRGL